MQLLEIINTFQDGIESIESRSELSCALHATMERIGFRFFALTHHVDFDHAPAGTIRLHNYPEGWAEYFDANGLGIRDPVHRASQLRNAGFAWSALAEIMQLTPEDELVLRGAREAGIGDGYTVPFHVPGEYSGSCSFAMPIGVAMNAEQIAAAQLLGTFAFEAARRLDAKERARQGRGTALTQRQRQCVVWLGHGKSEWEIGKILALSPRTVNQHLKRARERCGVSKSSLLVVHALLQGSITYSELLSR